MRAAPRVGCVIFLLVLLAAAAVVAYVQHNPTWLVVLPIAILALLFFLALALAFVFGALERLFGIGRRKTTPEEFADALEKHLLGTEGPWDWDDATSVVLADPRLEAVRQRLGPNLDALAREEDRAQLRGVN